MKLISHRGNLNGRIPERENTKDYIEEAFAKGYDVEIDLWGMDSDLYLGHDKPLNYIDKDFIDENSTKLWCHAKNVEAFRVLTTFGMYPSPLLNFFWHQNDDYTFTSHGYIWTYPGKQIFDKRYYKQIMLIFDEDEIPNINDLDTYKSFGVCSDFIERFEKLKDV